MNDLERELDRVKSEYEKLSVENQNIIYIALKLSEDIVKVHKTKNKSHYCIFCKSHILGIKSHKGNCPVIVATNMLES